MRNLLRLVYNIDTMIGGKLQAQCDLEVIKLVTMSLEM
jgi:hypothetical protein